MALVLDFSATKSVNGKSINVTETTGVYALGNTGGWGAPNPEIADATAATFTLAKRNTDNTYTDAPIPTVDVYPDLPNITSVKKNITAEAFGYGTDAVFTDGIYRGIYNVTTTGPVENTVTEYFVLIYGIESCLKRLDQRVSACTCDCDSLKKKQRDIMFWYRLLKSARCCANLTQIQAYIDKLTRLCSSCGCS